MIKTPSHPTTYKRERDVYEFDCIQKSQCIRRMYESFDDGTDQCMVFEWMESDLWSLRGRWRRDLSPNFPKTLARWVLMGLEAIGDVDGQGVGVQTGKILPISRLRRLL